MSGSSLLSNAVADLEGAHDRRAQTVCLPEPQTAEGRSLRHEYPRHPSHLPSGRSKDEDYELGRGRSGVVYRSRDESGRDIARKVFGAGGLTKVVQYVFLGAPNPYMWNEPAVRCAVLRRRILAVLVDYWFGAKLRVARAYDYDWNTNHRAYEMRCELIDGRHVALHHSYTLPGDTELQDATRHIMKPLQARLAEAGFDGLVWQAGRGNPVALNNFMCEGSDGDGGYRWVWIDRCTFSM